MNYTADSNGVLQAAHKPVIRVEIARSFSFKVNRGNYESSDYFCSQKGECDIDEADDFSERLYQFCKSQVMRAVRDDMAEAQRAQQQRMVAGH